jgi:hypothetical protein
MKAMTRKGPTGEREKNILDFKIRRAYELLENFRFIYKIDFLLTRNLD